LTRAPADPPQYRFDDPDREFSVTYGNTTDIGAFVEVYGDTQRVEASQRHRWVTQLESQRPLLLLDMDDASTQKAFGLDARIGTARQYATTQQWSRTLHGWYPDADGIRYRSRHENSTLNVCLFLDRCAHVMTISNSEPLEALGRSELLRLLTPYRIVVDW